MAFLDTVIIAAGIYYGYSNHGKEDRIHILKKGLRIGLIAGVILAVIRVIFGGGFSAMAVGMFGIIGIVIVALVITLEFILGTYIGDFLEEKFKKTT